MRSNSLQTRSLEYRFAGIGLNHKTAPVRVRERVAFPEVGFALKELKPLVQEVLILSTCNRTELYSFSVDPGFLLSWLCGYHGIRIEEIYPHIYFLEDEGLVEHLYYVASGLDSMVIGETQILGQIKKAMNQAQEEGTLGSNLNYLFQSALSVAKEVRSSTNIGMSTVSIAAAALKLMRKTSSCIESSNVLLIGAGEMIEMIAKYFVNCKPKRLTIVNRTLEKARRLAEEIPGSDIYSLNDLPYILYQYDAAISSTTSPNYVIRRDVIKDVIRQRRKKSMFLLDLAVPRDIDVTIDRMDGVFLFSIDDLENIVQEGKESRFRSVEMAKEIIMRRVEEFRLSNLEREKAPLISMIRSKAEEIRGQMISRAEKDLRKGVEPFKVMDLMSRRLTNKLMHLPTEMIKKSGYYDQIDTLKRILK